jgi:hypothetical protein
MSPERAGIRFAVAAVVSSLSLALPALGAERTDAEVILARRGQPSSREFVPCGGQDPRDACRCVRWQYDEGTTHLVYYFDVRTQRIVEATTWDEATREATTTSAIERHVEAASRVAVGP